MKKEKWFLISPGGSKSPGIDYCVLCGSDSGYDMTTPISDRNFYLEGAGQLCGSCYRKLSENHFMSGEV